MSFWGKSTTETRRHGETAYRQSLSLLPLSPRVSGFPNVGAGREIFGAKAGNENKGALAAGPAIVADGLQDMPRTESLIHSSFPVPGARSPVLFPMVALDSGERARS